jgi:uncharacterized coiled-coil DUF342 family protein
LIPKGSIFPDKSNEPNIMGRKDIDYLDEERRKLWVEVVAQREKLRSLEEKTSQLQSVAENLESELAKKTSDYEKEAKNSSAQTTRYKNRASDAAKTIEESHTRINEILTQANEINSRLEHIVQFSQVALQRHNDFEQLFPQIEAERANLVVKVQEAVSLQEDVESSLEEAQGLAAKIEEIKISSESTYSKISSAHSGAIKKGAEVTELYQEIFGYTATEEESGDDVEVPGLRSELEDAYSSLKKNVADLSRELSEVKQQRVAEFERFSESKAKEYDQIKERISGLLPDAMTAGLSHAYEQKRKSEEKEGKDAATTYWKSIGLLLVISFIPVVVSVYSFFHDNKTLDQVIHNLPQIVLATLPLYAPAFWFAISASKRIKLARRLTEEYAHKEALSKTFEGLSTQISNLPDSEISRDLRAKLLYNIISVSSENPGKLISDYNNSDNPLLEVLDRSLSLTKSLEKISSIPGVDKILRKVEQKRKGDRHKIEDSIEGNIPADPNGRSSRNNNGRLRGEDDEILVADE